MPDNKEEKAAQAAKEKNEANTKKVSDFLNENKLDVRSQLLLVLENGDLVPIRGITSQALVVEKEDGQQQPPQPDSGQSKD